MARLLRIEFAGAIYQVMSRRILFRDLMAYKRQMDAERLKVLD